MTDNNERLMTPHQATPNDQQTIIDLSPIRPRGELTMGKPREIRWSWQSKDNYLRTGYMAVDGRMSIAELIEHLRTVAPGVDPADIQINWATAVWSRPGTAEEIDQRRRVEAAHEARHEAWERETLARLTEKYAYRTLRIRRRFVTVRRICRRARGEQ